MRTAQLLNMRQSKAKTRFRNQFKTYKKLLQEMGKNVVFTKIKRHNELIMSMLEVDDIILICRDALRYFLVAFILLCLCASW